MLCPASFCLPGSFNFIFSKKTFNPGLGEKHPVCLYLSVDPAIIKHPVFRDKVSGLYQQVRSNLYSNVYKLVSPFLNSDNSLRQQPLEIPGTNRINKAVGLPSTDWLASRAQCDYLHTAAIVIILTRGRAPPLTTAR